MSTLRDGTKNKLALSAPLSETITRIAQETRSWFSRIPQIVSAETRRANKYRLRLLAIATTVTRNLRRAQSFLSTAVVRSRNRLWPGAHYKTLFRLYASYKPDLTTLRRATAPLVILLVMMVFVIQEIVMVIQR